MKSKKNYIYLTIVFFFLIFIFCFNNKSYAGELYLDELKYDVTLNEDGSADVVETWDVDISDTNTLFKDFYINRQKYSEITDVTVRDLKKNIEYKQIDEEMYHVTPKCFYALPINSGSKFEIAWNVGFDNSSGQGLYQISYKIIDCIKVYEDCSEFYWQFIGTDNSIPVKNISGRIKLPSRIDEIEKLRIWAHGDYSGEIYKDQDKQEVVFKVPRMNAGTMLEVRVVEEEDVFPEATHIDEKKLDGILHEEKQWAEEANRKREQEEREIKIILGIIIGVSAFFIGLFLIKLIKNIKRLINLEDKIIVEDIQYFRDIPREREATPGEAAFLYYMKNNSTGAVRLNVSNIISATILQLALKKCISFSGDENEMQINFIKDCNEAKDVLKTDEFLVYELLQKSSKNGQYTTMKELNSYGRRAYDSINSRIDNILNEIEKSHSNIGNYSKDKKDEVNSLMAQSLAYIIVGFCVIYLLPISILLFLNGFVKSKTAKKINLLTEKGCVEKEEWEGLFKYITNYSLLEEKTVPDLVLWEKYLVYATVFGVSKKVIKELKVQLANCDVDMYSSNLTYLPYMMHDNYFDRHINSDVKHFYNTYNSAYNSAHYSDSSGGGGGFSGGGGRRRPEAEEWVEDKTQFPKNEMRLDLSNLIFNSKKLAIIC